MKKLDAKTEARIEEIIRTLTLEQKVGQKAVQKVFLKLLET